MIDETNFPVLSNLEETIKPCLAASFTGFLQKRGLKFGNAAIVACRLVDKAIFDYENARRYYLMEEEELSMSEKEILKRGSGHHVYSVGIINHLENCFNSIARIYKLLPILGADSKSNHSKSISGIRDSIEHMDARISSSVEGPLSPGFSKNKPVVTIGSKDRGRHKIDTIRMTDLAAEITRLHGELVKILNTL